MPLSSSRIMTTTLCQLAVIIWLVLPQVASATEQFDFASAVIQSLWSAKIANEREKPGDVGETMTALITFSSEIRQAGKLLDKYASSSDQSISHPAQVLQLVYSTVADIGDEMVDLLEQTLNDPNGALSQPGTLMRRTSELRSSMDETWRMLLPLLAGVAQALVDHERLEHGKIIYLKITDEEKSMLLRQLEDAFSDEVRSLKGETHAIDASAALFWKFLDSKWRSSDDQGDLPRK